MYADDVQIYIGSPRDEIAENIRLLNHDLSRVSTWAKANGLCLNPIKSKCVVIRNRLSRFSCDVGIFINDSRLEIVPHAKNLGVVINSTLTWSNHIDSVVGQGYSKLRALWATQSVTPLRIRSLLAKTYLVPGILYGCELFANCDSQLLFLRSVILT
ncbi:uncharacterized protein LOC131997928 [Stomoxys calcitrans]|uniref:uncharacterized protein LOC131997928 n=1 Tax=Stomoxys calcitrans TaxID=35570 RepID=UPI0027E2DA06|nr:uncharacterized protein LOC131997928 [Stomoxys calcitrans]